jgi:hypothetical protein
MDMAPKKGSKRIVKDRPALDFNAAVFGTVTERKTMAEYRRTRGERDAEQKQIDAIVDAAYNAWIEAGKPTEWVDQPGTMWTGPKEQADTLMWRVHRSGQHYSLKIKFGDLKTYTGEDGKEYAEVIFVVTDRPANDVPDAEEEEAAEDEAAEARDAADEDFKGEPPF